MVKEREGEREKTVSFSDKLSNFDVSSLTSIKSGSYRDSSLSLLSLSLPPPFYLSPPALFFSIPLLICLPKNSRGFGTRRDKQPQKRVTCTNTLCLSCGTHTHIHRHTGIEANEITFTRQNVIIHAAKPLSQRHKMGDRNSFLSLFQFIFFFYWHDV